MYLVLIPHCMTEILAKECKSGKSTVLALGAVKPTKNFVVRMRKGKGGSTRAVGTGSKMALYRYFSSATDNLPDPKGPLSKNMHT